VTQTTVEDQVRDVLDLLRPQIQMDGGDIRLQSVEKGVVTVQLLGVCETCPISPVTLKQGVERILRDRIPGVTEVIALEA
jgi:Fe-S cluster biogenesis protein NfuA